MPPKTKPKVCSMWYCCDECRVVLSHKEVQLHREGSCPPLADVWTHGFIKNNVLYSWLEEVKGSVKSFPQEELVDMVWMSLQALQLCRFCVGDPVILTLGNVSVIKTVWPTTEGSLTSVLLTKDAMELAWGTCEGCVSVRKLPDAFPPASEIIISQSGKTQLTGTSDILVKLHQLNIGKYVHVGNYVCVPHYGKNLKFQVDNVVPISESPRAEVSDDLKSITETFQNLSFGQGNKMLDGFSSTPVKPNSDRIAALRKETTSDDSLEKSSDEYCSLNETHVRNLSRRMMDDSYADNTAETAESEADTSVISTEAEESPCKYSGKKLDFFHIVSTTKWTLSSTHESQHKNEFQDKNVIQCVGGLQDIIKELREIISLALKPVSPQLRSLKVARGVLLYGPPGTGKTLLARALAQEINATLHMLQGPELFSKFLGETESRLKDFFSKASSSGHNIILLDEVDSLCPKKSNNTSGTELERRVIATLSTLLDGLQANVFVLATTSRLDSVDPALRRPGRLDREIEVPVPSPNARFDILMKLVDNIPHDITEGELQSVARVTHGYVGADLAALISRAGAQAVRVSNNRSELKLSLQHLEWALTRINPSAMREVLVDVPNVYWSDIAGQEELKLKLKQAVEWPLTHPEAFQRLGIRPPRGVLMFGPPGCSKTMIAKALATESKLNFLSIKGPELFSKWVGESERAVREVFRRARQVSPAIVFFDELDALGGERSSGGGGGGSNVQERVLAQLLTEMDGVTALGSITVVAATNRPDRIDKALLRPGRLDRIVYVPLPDDGTREQIFSLQLKKMPVDTALNVKELVKRTIGYSGAEVLAVCHEAALKALEEDLEARILTERHFQKALSIITPRTPPSLLKLYDDYLST